MTFAEITFKYVMDVINDTLPSRQAGRFEKLACQRFLNDIDRENDDDFPFYIDADAGEAHCEFMSFLKHTKGKWRGKNFVMEPHQVFMHFNLFAWKNKETGFRRFTKADWFLPRKNGKSFSASGIALQCGFAENEPQSEVYCAATTEAQAGMVFGPAWQMVHMDADLKEAFGLTLAGTLRNPTSIYRASDMSRIEPIIGTPKDGTSPSLGIVDEYHEHKTSALYDCLDTGQGARDNPIMLMITTAGVDISGPCYQRYLDAVKILEGTLVRENVFPMIFGADEGDDFQDFNVWLKANPNAGVSLSVEYLRGKYNDAISNLAQRNILLTKHLNMWMNAGLTAFDMLKYKENARPEFTLEQFKGKKCIVSLDLASKIDILALEIMFELEDAEYDKCPRCGANIVFENERYVCENNHEEGVCSWERKSRKRTVVFSKFYLPEETVRKKENESYQLWEKQGLLTVTEGTRTDMSKVEDDLKKLNEEHIIQELVFDPREASYLIQNIQKWAGFECIEFTQSPALISEPMKELEAMIVDNCFLHDGNEVLTWMFGNVVKKQSKSGGNVKHYFPTKQNDGNKIDGAVACIMALGRMIVHEDTGDSYNMRAARGEKEILRVV